jgi:4-hydroxy-tetrahydrodipicolinate reductase
MRSIRAVIYGVGAMNTLITRLVLEKGIDVVGAIDPHPDKVGLDLGEATGLGSSVGVEVEADAEGVLSTRAADIAVVAVSSYMSDIGNHFQNCARHGVNAISTSEEGFYPWRTSPVITANLDKLARGHGVTLTASGHQDVYWHSLANQLMATAHRVDAVVGRASWNVADYGPEVARDQQVGATPDEFAQWAAAQERPPTFGRVALDAIVAANGLTAESVEATTRPVIAPRDTRCDSLGITVPRGRVIGFTDVDSIVTVQGVTLTMEATGALYQPGEADTTEWEVRGEPEVLQLSTPAVPTRITTCTQMVNRIPDVIAAPPGFVTVDQLPPLRYRAFPLPLYLPDVK